MSIETLLADLTTALNENTKALLASKAGGTEVVLSGASTKEDGGTTATKATTKPAEKPTSKPATKPAEKPTSKPATKPAEKPETKVSEKTYTDDDIRAIAKGYLGVDDVKLREQRKAWIVGLIGELGATQAVGIATKYRPAFDAWVQEATRTDECPDYEAYVDGSYAESGETEEADDEV